MKRAVLFVAAFGLVATAMATLDTPAPAQQSTPKGARDMKVNLAVVANATASFVSGDQTIVALNDGFDPRSSRDTSHAAFGNWPSRNTQWVEYTWPAPITAGGVDVYWYLDGRNLRAPAACRLKYWDGNALVPVGDKIDVESNRYNSITFEPVTTNRLRLEFDSDGQNSVGILEWRVQAAGDVPNLPPVVVAGADRIVVGQGKTYLRGTIKAVGEAKPVIAWSKESGPGTVTFADAKEPVTTATFSEVGEYVLKLTGTAAGADGAATANDGLSKSSTLKVRVESPPPSGHWDLIDSSLYSLQSPLWNDRVKALIVGWIPHCYTQLSNVSLREGGINNFIQAANKLNGRPHTPNSGYPFTDAYVHNTVEAMCLALLVKSGDPEVVAAQKAIREKLEEWIPTILSAQEPDGYLQTRFTRDVRGAQRWTIRGDHEGYASGYFLEAAIAHFRATEGTDRRMYDAAKRLADCWENNLGPAPKKAWYDGHEEMEYALVRFARLVDEVDGKGKGDKYVALSKFLMDNRMRGGTYDQSHLPVQQQYEAVGHAVRAVYLYTGMSEMALLTRDNDYQSAVRSLWDNIVNRKYYITGGVGSGESSEGFGPNYSLRNSAYCESCSSCGEIYFQASLGRTYQDAKYADLFEQTLYNALLGSVDLEGKNFGYTNPLDERSRRTAWHVCPCCVGNIPRTLLQLPTWMYAKGSDGITVNLYAGSAVTIEDVVGMNVQLIQETDYPWSGDVKILIIPAEAKTYTIRLRSPQHDVSTLYTASPKADGIEKVTVNGEPVEAKLKNGYVELTREWAYGDTIELKLPMTVQRVKCNDVVAANRGRVALRVGPLVYNIEAVDGDLNRTLAPDAPLETEWRGDFLHGVRVITGKFSDGSPLLAVPNYARNNRAQPRSLVWIREP